MAPGETGRAAPVQDVRRIGFAHRAPLGDALAWVEANARRLGPEPVAAADAPGRVLAEPVAARDGWPAADLAALDGYAVRAAHTEGADAYAPLALAGAVLVAAGQPLPPGADAVLPFEAASDDGAGGIEALAPVARGHGIERAGGVFLPGQDLLPAGWVLRPEDVAVLVLLGLSPVRVVRRPRVRLVMPGPKGGGADALTPMLMPLIARDGGAGEAVPCPHSDQSGLARACALAAEGADMVLIAGRSGAGPDDAAAPALTDAGGRLDLHGVALRPGASAGLGRIGAAPVVLLAGDPAGCLAAYDMLAAPALRRLAGLPPSPHRAASAVLERKLVSAAGYTDVVRVRLDAGRAVPLGTAEAGGLVPGADGFVVVPEESEGFPAGATVPVHLEESRHG